MNEYSDEEESDDDYDEDGVNNERIEGQQAPKLSYYFKAEDPNYIQEIQSESNNIRETLIKKYKEIHNIKDKKNGK